MPVITVNDQHYALRPGQNRLGAGAGADVRVSDDDALGIQAIVDVRESAHPVIRRAMPTAAVRVNGVSLIEPTPLIHGDKVEIAGSELLYSDDTKTGATQVLELSQVAAIAASHPHGVEAVATAGRVVSLVDGKEYQIPAAGLSIGRDAGNTIVLSQNDVSRKHAVIVPVESGGYEIRDLSANGVMVNGKRTDQRRALTPSDLIKIGSEEFRFRAEAPAAARPEKTPSAAPTPPQPPAAVTPAVEPQPIAPTVETRRTLATLQIVNVGPTNGQQFEIRVPLAHIGRGAHNDVVINDESVSDSHAKLQCRDDGWYVTDLGSTNGTYVGGARLTGEKKLDGPADVRFGGVKLSFRPSDLAATAAKGTGAVAGVSRPQLNPTTSVPAVLPSPEPQDPPQPGISLWVWGVVVLAMAAAAAFFLLNS